MSEKKYWQNFGERNSSESSRKLAENEFQEDLPMESFDSKGLLEVKTPRRDFLKYLGFSTAAATLAASCEVPVRKVIPYLNKPENMIPGVADYYATTYVSGGDAVSIVAKVRDGRPIKLEGNELSGITHGGTSARVQASVLDLYDTARLRYPVQMVNGLPQEVTSFEAFDKLVSQSMAGQSGSLVLLTSTITSPTSNQIISEFLAKYPGSRHIQYDADSFSGMLLANEAAYGKRSIPSYHFENAKVIVSLGADFLGTWLSPVEFARQYAKGRKIDEKAPEMNRHYQFESLLSMTGANADERFAHKPSETGAVALSLLAALGGNVTAPSISDKLKAAVAKVAKDLSAAKGKALVVCGSNDMHIQLIVNAINEAVGANGTTISWSSPFLTRQGIDSEFSALVDDMNAGKISSLLIYDANPAYDFYDAKKFKTGLEKVKTSVSFNGRLDETSELCKYVLPSPHFLERWGDAQPKPGYISLIQPVIAPLFLTRPYEDSLMKWSGNNTGSYDEFFKKYWEDKLGGLEAYEKALQDGVLESKTTDAGVVNPAGVTASYNGSKLADAVTAIGSKKGSDLELVLYMQVSMGTGSQANNPWLLEFPDPITRGAWDNYAMVSPKFLKDNYDIDLSDAHQADSFEVHPERPVIRIKANGKETTIPIVPVPGTAEGVIAIAVGYGRESADPKNTASFIGRAVPGAGRNAYPFATSNGTTVDWSATGVSFEKTNEEYQVAFSQTHNSYEGRTSVIKEMSLEDFIKDPNEVPEERENELKKFGGIENYEKDGTLYGYYDKPGIHWGMSIDLNSCVGCGACVIACHAENNVAVVGKNEVMRFHDMHWLRIDRYFTGNYADPDSVQTIFQPMLCQHCDNAPCENVCPVSATNHSSEGLNQMVYNRCIGTRYCANNCPFKVRRFNWADYTQADSFPNNQDQHGVGVLNDSVLMMNDDLTRMVLNPDVTVRSRGVMEKCSFCVQRLQDGKLKAKKEDRPLLDMVDVRTSCQQACPTEAIVFGNINDSKSAIVKERVDNHHRLYHVLEELHVLPNISYLAKVRNPESEAKA
ncbi:MAG: TAT-variant-translocated molybdopterin oxidoreductase [Bacteroidota bacterium]|nr:TAT-variant-translocated molybdopterin oxidoreductase [Bacteroidota bacterium]